MEWTRTETLALAVANCAHCQGLGLRAIEGTKADQPCNCVLRNIFRACYARFRECNSSERHVSRTSLAPVNGAQNKGCWSRKDEEYMADFTLVARRTLTPLEYRIFKYHHLLGADWKLCCRKLKMERGPFFHDLYRLEQRLGRIFRELEPFALYPLEEYFGGESKSVVCSATSRKSKILPLRPPLARPGSFQEPYQRAA